MPGKCWTSLLAAAVGMRHQAVALCLHNHTCFVLAQATLMPGRCSAWSQAAWGGGRWLRGSLRRRPRCQTRRCRRSSLQARWAPNIHFNQCSEVWHVARAQAAECGILVDATVCTEPRTSCAFPPPGGCGLIAVVCCTYTRPHSWKSPAVIDPPCSMHVALSTAEAVCLGPMPSQRFPVLPEAWCSHN